MAHGFMGKILFIDLAEKEIKEEKLDDKVARDYIGGYGLGAKILFERQKPGVDPLGPDAMLGMLTGMLTGTDAIGGSRYVMVGKSPLTGGWGDANSGGNVGPFLKFAGYDALFFSGISENPVYLYIENGRAEIRDASHLWGRDTFETEDILREEHGAKLEVVCIGPCGEKKSLLAAIMNNKGRAAGRSGLGAVMGSKKLKAIAIKGSMEIPVSDRDASKAMRKRHLTDMGPMVNFMREFGTCGMMEMCAQVDDAPFRNWTGTMEADMPDLEKIGGKHIIERQDRPYGCYRCPIACGGIMKKSTGAYEWGEHAHKPEYETQAMFGSNLLNSNVESIISANDMCNRMGIDTIGAGASVAFAVECYEKGIITRKDTGGLELKWGDPECILKLLDQIIRREGLGDILADGTKRASEKIGNGAEKYAMQVGGQEIPAHDSRGGHQFAIAYCSEPTPARHTMSGEGPHPAGTMPEYDPSTFKGRGIPHKIGACITQFYNAAGLCMICYGDGYGKAEYFIEAIQTISGWDIDRDEVIKTGQRINTMRQAFNIREGITTPWKYPDRMLGKPPKKTGPRAGFTMEPEEISKEYYQEMGWDEKTGRPLRKTLLELDMDFVVKELYD